VLLLDTLELRLSDDAFGLDTLFEAEDPDETLDCW